MTTTPVSGEYSADYGRSPNHLVEQALRELLQRGGRPPDEVAGLVFDAVRTGRFLVTTSDATEDMLRERFDAVLAGELPPMTQWDLRF